MSGFGASRRADAAVESTDAGAGAPFSARVADGACVLFGLWTLVCHATVLVGASLLHAMAGFAVGALALGVWLWRRSGAPRPVPAAQPADAPAAWSRRRRALQAALVAVALVGGLVLARDALAAWWWLVGVLSLALVLLVLPERARSEAPAAGRALEGGLWALALGCAALALAAHRPDLDDAFYVNLAVAAADAMTAPLLAGDTLHGVPDLPMHLPVYRLHSWEAWNAALSVLTGLPVIACFHFVSTAIGAALVPLALARLARLLTPRHWLWTAAATVFVLVAVGDVHRWYGNFAFVRIWQGKGLLLWVFLPLVQAYAIELAQRPRAAGFARLVAAQVAALGCSSSGLWVAPAAALAAAASAVPTLRLAPARLGLVLLSSSYLLAVGGGLRASMLGDESLDWVAQRSPEMEYALEHVEGTPPGARGLELEAALDLVVGSGRLRTAAWLCLLVAWGLCPPGLARRYAVVAPLAAALVLFDPYTADLVSGNLTGASFWRTLWVLPVPLLLALVLTAPLRAPLPRAGPRLAWLRPVAFVAVCATFAVVVPERSSLGRGNGVALGWPRLKVPEEPYRWARLLTERAGAGSVVAAPGDVTPWLATFHDRVYPVMVRPFYLGTYIEALGEIDVQLRILTVNYVGGISENPDASLLFPIGLERLDVEAVLLRRSPDAGAARRALRGSGFLLELKALDHEIWLRKPA